MREQFSEALAALIERYRDGDWKEMIADLELAADDLRLDLSKKANPDKFKDE